MIKRGAGATVIAVGPVLDRTLAAVEGLDVTVLYVTTVTTRDLDTAGIRERISRFIER